MEDLAMLWVEVSPIRCSANCGDDFHETFNSIFIFENHVELYYSMFQATLIYEWKLRRVPFTSARVFQTYHLQVFVMDTDSILLAIHESAELFLVAFHFPFSARHICQMRKFANPLIFYIHCLLSNLFVDPFPGPWRPL